MTHSLSYWEQTIFFDYDILVIGSGIVGLNAAIHLKRTSPPLKIAILERGFLPAGASTKNAGFACFGSVSELIEQEKICGSDGLVELIERRWLGLQKMRNLLGDKTIDYHNFSGYELFTKNDESLSEVCISKIEHFIQMINLIIGKDAFSVQNNKIPSFGFAGVNALIENRYEAQINTGKMMAALIDLATSLGVRLFNNCAVEELTSEGNVVCAHTKNGLFKGKRVIVCTNAFAKDLLPMVDVKPARGQVLITKPINNLPFKGCFHYDKGYYYFRNIEGRVLLGGGRNLDFAAEETADFGQTELVQNALENLLHTVILPNTPFEIEMCWSGIMGFGSELNPIVKEVQPNVFCGIRGNGMGVAIGTQTGIDVAELVLASL